MSALHNVFHVTQSVRNESLCVH